MTLSEIGAMLKELVAKSDAKQLLASEVADLKAQLVAANDAKATTERALAEHKTQLAAKESDSAALKAAKEKAESDLAVANSAKEAAESKSADLLANPSKIALELAAKAGVKPDQRPKADATSATKTLTKADFNAKPSWEKAEFVRNGGTVSQ